MAASTVSQAPVSPRGGFGGKEMRSVVQIKRASLRKHFNFALFCWLAASQKCTDAHANGTEDEKEEQPRVLI